jgi:hypothetical protein
MLPEIRHCCLDQPRPPTVLEAAPDLAYPNRDKPVPAAKEEPVTGRSQ